MQSATAQGDKFPLLVIHAVGAINIHVQMLSGCHVFGFQCNDSLPAHPKQEHHST
jgi:hypothetical protein